jgi:hypothetical protein
LHIAHAAAPQLLAGVGAATGVVTSHYTRSRI